MTTPRLYDELAGLWPLVSPPDDCVAEAEHVRDILLRCLGKADDPKRHSFLELGSGAGHTLCHFVDEFDAEAVDLSERMLDRSMALNPMVTHHAADLRTVRLGRCFDAVLAHDSLDYMLTEADLRAAFVTAAEHLQPGGLFVAAVNYTCETFTEHELAHDFHSDGEVDLTNISYVHAHPSGNGIELVMLLLVRQAGELRVEEDRHHCGLFPLATWSRLLDEVGFDVEQPDQTDAGTWFVAVKRQTAK